MKISQSFFSTEKATTHSRNDATTLLERGGFILQNAAGLYSLLPLGFRILDKIRKIIQSEFAQEEIEEFLMPVLQPARVWKESGRWSEVGDELWKIKNRFSEEFALAMTGEELILDSLKNKLVSHKNFPLILNQIQTKIRDEMRPRGGILRVREFTMQDAYSFDKDQVSMHKSYDKVFNIYKKIFQRLEIPVLIVQADPGEMGGDASHEFVVESPIGEDKIVRCSKCDYAANQEFATLSIGISEKIRDKKTQIETQHTPNITSALEVAEYLRVDPKQVLKTMIYIADKKMILAITRGDLEINLAKLKKLLRASDLRPANASEVDKAGLIAGFTSPYKLKKKLKIVADQSLKLGTTFIMGANKRDYHISGLSLRDIKIDIWADLTLVSEGSPCPICGAPLKIVAAVELGHIFQLGTKYSQSQKIYYTDEKNKVKPIFMGSYGIGLERQMGILAEIYKDRDGIAWPKSVAPFSFYLLNVGEDKRAFEIAEEIYRKFHKNYEIIFDDRKISAGEKFADADLVGIPYRITVSPRTLARSSVEIKDRRTKALEMVRIDKLPEKLADLIK